MRTIKNQDKQAIYNVGIAGYRKQIEYQGTYQQESIGTLYVSIGLPYTEKKGPISAITHIVSESKIRIKTGWSLESLLESIQEIIKADTTIIVRMPLSFPKESPVSKEKSSIVYNTTFAMKIEGDEYIPYLCGSIPLVTVCPCSLESAGPLAHMQRIIATFCIHSDVSLTIEEVVSLLEETASEKSYPILKQADEKYILEEAFSSPCFVEDVVRSMASSLHKHKSIQGYMVSVQSFESLHPHDIVGYAENNYKSLCTGLSEY